MRRMYAAVSVNLSHLAATLMLGLCERGITVMSLASFQRLLYLAVKLTQREPSVHLHRSLRDPQAYNGLIDGSCDGLEQLLSTAQSTGLVNARCELQMISTSRHGILYENIDGTQERIVAFLDGLDTGASVHGTG